MFKIAVTSAVATLAVAIGVTSLSAADRKSVPAPEGHPLDEIISGYEFRNKETQALQNDDFENPGFLWVDIGQELWDTADGAANKACADCHGDAAESMALAGAEFPKWHESLNRPVNLEQQINLCRTRYQEADEWKYESEPLLGVYRKNKHPVGH